MAKEEVQGKRPQAAPKTIKVSTVVIAVVWISTIIVALIFGWFSRSNFDATIKSEVYSQVQDLQSKLEK